MLGLLIVSLANPQVGSQTQTVRRTGIDILIALDVSRSMLATDIQPNRLERAKQWISRLVEQRTPTALALLFLRAMFIDNYPLPPITPPSGCFCKPFPPTSFPLKGTAVGESIDLATKIFANNDLQDNHPALIVLSDGEDHEAMAAQAADKPTSKEISIFSIGVGGARVARCPLSSMGGKWACRNWPMENPSFLN